MSKDIKQTQTQDGVISFTQSRLCSFMECPRKEFYMYRAGDAGVGLRLVKPETYFVEGEFAHYALAYWYKTGKMFRDYMLRRMTKQLDGLGALDPEDYDDYRVRMHAMIGAAHGYKAHYASDLKSFKSLGVETPFKLKLGRFQIEGRLDLTYKCDDGHGFMDHKFVNSFSLTSYEALPLNLQGLIYVLGFVELFGKMPDFYRYNFIRKTSLRKKGPTKANPNYREQNIEYEARVMQQYQDEPASMFFRPPPHMVSKSVVSQIQEQVIMWLEEWVRMSKLEFKQLPMCLSSCGGKYNTLCPFGPACTAFLLGKGEGWNAPECKALYMGKEVLHPELVEEKEETTETKEK